MKKILSILIMLLLLALPSTVAGASGYGSYDYYIEDFRVDVVANSDRSYDVTETITVRFNAESRGIIRDIQTSGAAERYRVEGIAVAAEPYTVTEYSDFISVRIGDPDVFITGAKTYVITYTRLHYDDGEPEHDYFYMDLIGDRWDVPVANFEATVRLPQAAVIEGYTLTSGPSGSTANNYAAGDESENVVSVRMKKPLGPFMAVTLNVWMRQGAFPDAAIYVKPLVIHNVNVSAVLDKYGVMTVTEDYDATVNAPVRAIHSSFFDGQAAVIAMVGPDGEPRRNGPLYYDFLDEYVGERVKFTFVYQKRAEITEWDSGHSFIVYLPGSSDAIAVEKFTFSAVSPFEITSAGFMEDFSYRHTDEYASSLSDNGRRLCIEADADAGKSYVLINFYSSGFVRRGNAGDFLAPLIAAAIAALLWLLAFVVKPEKKLVTPVEFSPPDGMNPAEMGYIIDGKISGRDVTSLIYYWASHGHLSIELAAKAGRFAFIKGSELDEAHEAYEKTMYEKLFRLGCDGKVTSDDLKETFYSAASSAAASVRRSFTGARSLYRAKHSVWACALALTIGCAVMFGAFARLWEFPDGRAADALFPATALCAVIAVVSTGYHANIHKKPKSNAARLALFAVLAAALASLVLYAAAGRALSIVSSLITIAAMAAAFYLLPYLRKKTDFNISILERIIGFKMFLQTAEKARLEMLLAQNSDYYYDILPYAQVLGVSNIWEKKFDSMLSQPPSWCSGVGAEKIMRAAGMTAVTRSISRSITSRPSSSSSGGGGRGSSGGGRGSSGGKLSGGGSSGGGGGGGGRRW